MKRFRRQESDPAPAHSDLDRWLVPLFSPVLDPIERAVPGVGPEGYRLFRGLDDDLWALLLTREYEAFPEIRSFLPELPRPELQQKWNGASGPGLAAQSVCFYRKLKEVQRRHGRGELAGASVLDFGCGWGRLTRMLTRDVEPGNLYGCDPVEEILETCRAAGMPATLFRSDFLPESLPVERRFDLIFAFSVFTHISERAARASFSAIAGALEPGGLLTFTIRPAAYLDMVPAMTPLLPEPGEERKRALAGPAYIFLPHDHDDHPQYDGSEMSYGESVITLPWIEQNWTDGFELVDVSLMLGDIYQVAITLRKR